MKCPHCLEGIHPSEKFFLLDDDTDGRWCIQALSCSECGRTTLNLIQAAKSSTWIVKGFNSQLKTVQMRPRGSNRPPISAEVPKKLAEDYMEACLVLPDSPKASAALSRRCLQSLLRDAAKVTPGDLFSEIQQVIDSHTLPSYLVESIDAVRVIGNFGAHPVKSKSSGEILDVEAGEAEWNLDVLESLFDFYYVRPAHIKAKKAALNQKLAEAGKPQIK